MKNIFFWLIIASMFIHQSPAYSSSIVECLGRWAKLNYIKTQRNVAAWAKSVKENGAKRLLIKQKNPTNWELSEKKFYGLLYAPNPANSTKWYFSPITTVVQAPLKISSKLVTGKKGLEVTAFSDQFYITKLEKMLLKDKSFTTLPRMILSNLPSIPIYAYVYGKLDESKTKESLKADLNKEFIYEKINNSLIDKTITEEQALELVAQMKLAYDTFFDVMNQLHTEGHLISDIKTTEAILSDSQFAPFLEKLMPNVWMLNNKKELSESGLDISELKEINLEQLHQIMQLEYAKYAGFEMIKNYVYNGTENSNITELLNDERLSRILYNKMEKSEKVYHLQKILHYKTLLTEWETMGIKFKLDNGENETFERWVDEYLTNLAI
ncbi:MAG: hypothetical protein JNM93_06330 [Bacteriovoracaceae bacterium]|nr:hypothetical protein [Bacteriovoracaceae bacterium]